MMLPACSMGKVLSAIGSNGPGCDRIPKEDIGALVSKSRGWFPPRLLTTLPPSNSEYFFAKMEDEFTADSFAAFKTKQAAAQREAAMAKAVADPETAAILAETRGLQQETVESSRTAAKIIKETMIVGEKTTAQLRDQGEQLKNIEVVAEEADKHAQDAYKQAKDLHKYKGLLPISIKNMFTGGKKKAQDSELEKVNKKLDKQSKKLEDAGGKAEAGLSPILSARKSSLGAYANDPAEREINNNLDIISAGLDQLKAQGYAMQKEIADQNITLARIEARTDHTEYVIDSSNRKIKEFL